MIVGQYRYFQSEIMPRSRDRRPRLSETSYLYSGQTRASVPTGLYLFHSKRASLHAKERLSSLQGNALFKWRRAFPCFFFIVSVYRIIASLYINPASPSQLPLGTPPLGGGWEGFQEGVSLFCLHRFCVPNYSLVMHQPSLSKLASVRHSSPWGRLRGVSRGRFLVLFLSFLSTELQPRYTPTQPLLIVSRQAHPLLWRGLGRLLMTLFCLIGILCVSL